MRSPSIDVAVLSFAGALLAACFSQAADVRSPRAETRTPPEMGWLHGRCLAMSDPDLAPGTPVQVVRLDDPQRVVAASVEGPARSAMECKPMLEGREGLIGSQPAHYYAVTAWSDDDAEMAVGVVGAATAIRIVDGRARLDLNGDGEQEVVAVCATGEGIRFGAWTGEPYAGEPLWTGYYGLGYDLEPSCPQS